MSSFSSGVLSARLAVAYHEGHGVARDDAAAFAWTLKAANQGLALAEFNLGAMYADGIGTRKHQAQAAIWRRAADHRFTGPPVGRFFS